MRRMVVTSSVLALLASLVVPVYAQDTKSARGTVTAIAGDTVTVKAGMQELKLMVDAKTTVVTEGGGTATRAATAKGAAGPKLTELLKVGENVEVSYREAGGVLHATNVRRVSSPGSGGGGTSDQKAAEKSETASGNVTDVSQTSLTIAGSGSGGTKFTQTYTIDANTKVVGEGVGTAASKGKVTITDLVRKNDPVTVTYTASGGTLHATEVRVRRPQ
jgi:Domain of unknown function (DUF5666)